MGSAVIDTVFEHADVLDVVAGELLPDRHVSIRDGVIVGISTEPVTETCTTRIDATGRTLMPGLCDAHVHVYAASPDFAVLDRWAKSYLTARATEIMRDMLFRGFTTVRDTGGADHGLAKAVEETLFLGPRLLFCGQALTQTGGHGDMRLPGETHCPGCGGLDIVCDGVPEVRRACREQIRKGATHLKLMVSGGVSSPTDRISSTQFAMEELIAAVEEAEAAEIYCTGHAYTSKSIQRAVTAGFRSIEHGNLMDEETAAMMAEHGTFLIPTLVTYEALATEGVAAGLPASMRSKVDVVLDAGLTALARAEAAGVQIAYGTDLLGTMHRHQLKEFAIRAKVQKPIDIIRSATVTAAKLFKMEGQIGVVATDARADLLLVDGNPLNDLGVLQDPERYLKVIMRDGEIVRSAANEKCGSPTPYR
jgi:imidazolonepropionase-like amidohydrolase